MAQEVRDHSYFRTPSVVNKVHPQMKLASDKPLEAVLEGKIFQIFLGEHAPIPLDYAMQQHSPCKRWRLLL